MNANEPIQIAAVEGSDVSPDAGSALLMMRDAEHQPVNLAVPIPLTHELMGALSAAVGNAGKITSGNPTIKHAFPVDWWNVGTVPGTDNVILSFRLPGGMELSFVIHRDAADRFQETLNATLGRAASPPGAPRH